MPSPVQPIFPALYLYPLNDSFIPKHIFLAHGQRVKIGRQTNAKTAPGERNGYFDSKVLSRQHAEVWEEAGKIFIKDVKSSNGTFINGDRLSPEGLESDPNELRNDDIVEFGIDIVGDDNKTIIHHKVAARVVCVFTEQDVAIAARIEQINQHASQFPPSQPAPGPSQHPTAGGGPPPAPPASFPFQQRRPQLTQQGLAGMGGMGGGLRPPGKSGLTFDHILSRLQGELQKSRETSSELHMLTGAMNDIHDTLGGNLPSAPPSYPPSLPPVRAPVEPVSPFQPSQAPSVALTTSALAELQSRLTETQSSLSTHADKVRALEGALADQETIRLEVRALRELVETTKREEEQQRDHPFEEEEEDMHHDDDARSIATIMPHELDRVEEEDEEQLAAAEASSSSHEEERSSTPEEDLSLHDREAALEARALEDEQERRRLSELGRPRTPEPTNLGMRSTLANGDTFAPPTSSSKLHRSPLSRSFPSFSSPESDSESFTHVLQQLGSLLTLTSSLEAQHAAAQSTISALESKVALLEASVKATAEAQAQAAPPAPTEPEAAPVLSSPPSLPTVPSAPVPTLAEEREVLTTMVSEWKKGMEGQWSSVREDWDKERSRLAAAREQWEGQVRSLDTGLAQLGEMQTQQEEIKELLAAQQQQQRTLVNGDAKHETEHIGLVTPPSPRSLSSDSNRPRRKTRRGRSRQRSRSASSEGTEDTDATLASEDPFSPQEGTLKRVTSSPLKAHVKQEDVYEAPAREEEEDGDDTVLGVRSSKGNHNGDGGAETLATPESSVYLPSKPQNGNANASVSTVTKTRERELIQLQTAVGVIVLGVAAAAVLWRVKPET